MARLVQRYGLNVAFVALIAASVGDLCRDLTTAPLFPRFDAATLTLRLVACSYLFAFASMHVQVVGLCGQGGLFPLRASLDQMRRWMAGVSQPWAWGAPAQSLALAMGYVAQTMLGGAATSDARLTYFTLSACVAAAVGVAFPHPVVFVYLYLSYYSLKRLTAQVTNLQWDSLLLEAGVTAVAMSAAVGLRNLKLVVICNWLVKLLLFRLMFGSGFVKVFSSDPSWKAAGGYTAMTNHFLTQPLPAWTGAV